MTDPVVLLRHALAMLVPAVDPLPGDHRQELRDFYRYHACLTEPWDGPAGLVFTDGRLVRQPEPYGRGPLRGLIGGGLELRAPWPPKPAPWSPGGSGRSASDRRR